MSNALRLNKLVHLNLNSFKSEAMDSVQGEEATWSRPNVPSSNLGCKNYLALHFKSIIINPGRIGSCAGEQRCLLFIFNSYPSKASSGIRVQGEWGFSNRFNHFLIETSIMDYKLPNINEDTLSIKESSPLYSSHFLDETILQCLYTSN